MLIIKDVREQNWWGYFKCLHKYVVEVLWVFPACGWADCDSTDTAGVFFCFFFPTEGVDLWPRQAWMIALLEKADAGSPLLPLEEAED